MCCGANMTRWCHTLHFGKETLRKWVQCTSLWPVCASASSPGVGSSDSSLSMIASISSDNPIKSGSSPMWDTVFPWIVPADTINLSHRNDADTIWGRILFGGGHYYFHARGDTALAPSDGAQTREDTGCGRGVDLYRFFPTCAGVSPLVLGLASSIDDPRERCFSWLLLPRGPNYLNGRVRILIEGG